ncbi:DUF262 domain-containing protein [Brachybacterium avium]|nr:DUF262 domain-containing protein [Brachybacterium avium]
MTSPHISGEETEVEDSSNEPAGSTPSASDTLRHFTADFDVDGVVRRLKTGNFIVPNFNPAPAPEAEYAGFQRNFVWTKKQKDRFIESLLLGFPIPGIFLVEQPGKKYLVLDGQQRLRTLRDFVTGTDSVTERTFRLSGLGDESRFYGKAFADLDEADRDLLLNTFLQVTIVVPREAGNLQGVYQLFERINSGGTKLQPQEIRIALYAGSRVDALRELNDDPHWREIFGRKNLRLKDTELILRYLALRRVAQSYDEFDWTREAPQTASEAHTHGNYLFYRAPLSQFLNTYLESLGDNGTPDVKAMETFRAVVKVLSQVGPTALRLEDSAQINAAHADAMLVGLSMSPRIQNLADSLQSNPGKDFTEEVGNIASGIDQRLADLLQNDEYQRAIRESTSHLASVYARLKFTSESFRDL